MLRRQRSNTANFALALLAATLPALAGCPADQDHVAASPAGSAAIPAAAPGAVGAAFDAPILAPPKALPTREEAAPSEPALPFPPDEGEPLDEPPPKPSSQGMPL